VTNPDKPANDPDDVDAIRELAVAVRELQEEVVLLETEVTNLRELESKS
jgi:hypothetical protein